MLIWKPVNKILPAAGRVYEYWHVGERVVFGRDVHAAASGLYGTRMYKSKFAAVT